MKKQESEFIGSFYKDKENFVFPAAKKFFRWIIINVPDCSLLIGWQRKAINIGLIILSIFLGALVLMEGVTVLGLISKIIVIGLLTSVFYSKTISFVMLKTIAQYQKNAEKVLGT